jgi:amino-acid N-acetyltransferase
VTRARMRDVEGIVALVERYARQGEILPRSPEEIYQTLREWVVAKQDNQLVGCGSLVILWADLAEVRSLIVAPEVQGLGIGREMVNRLIEQAQEMEIPQVFALTRKPDFFFKTGFHQVPRETLPRKIWKDCIYCTKFVGCDEVAVVKALDVAMEGDVTYRIQMPSNLIPNEIVAE